MVSRMLAVALAAAALGPGAATAKPQPEVLIVGDSVATGMLWHMKAVAVMQKNLAVDWQIAVCRTVDGVSCPFHGMRPPTLMQLLPTLDHVPAQVVVELGYNDTLGAFADEVDEAVQALVAAGAKHVLWLTLRDLRPPYPAMNDILAAAARRYPQLELVDWNAVSTPHYPWFQSDGIHLVEGGGIAMAHLIHGAVVAQDDPLRILDAPLPKLQPRRAYAARLQVAGGTPPYRFSVAAGRPPRGIHLLANGRIYGRARSLAHASFAVRVTDADGVTAVRRVGLGQAAG